MKKLNALWGNPYFWGVVVFIAAGFFRMFFLSNMEFHKPDPTLNVFEIIQFFSKPYLIERSNATITPGYYYFPLSHYVLLLLSVPSRNPIVIAGMIALLNTLGIVFFYWWVRRFYGNTVSVIASLFLSLSPWSILYSRSIFVPDLLLPFSILFLYFAHRAILERKSLFWYGFSGSLLIQIHPPGLFLVAITTLYLFIWLRNARYHIFLTPWEPLPREAKAPKSKKIDIFAFLKKIIAGFLIGSVFIIPYVIGLIKPSQQFPWVVQIAPILRFSAHVEFVHFLLPFQMLTGYGFNTYFGKSWIDFVKLFPFIPIIYSIFILEMMLPFVAFYYILKKKRNLSFLVALVLMMPLLYFISKSYPNVYYEVPIIPVTAILTGLAFAYVQELVPERLKKVLWLGLILIIVLHVMFEATLYSFLSKREFVGGEYGQWTYKKTNAFVEANTADYANRDDYDYIKGVGYVYSSQYDVFHDRMGEYFAQTGDPYLAIEEYKKQLEVSKKNFNSRANLAFLYIKTGQNELAQKEVTNLSLYKPSLAVGLQKILDQTKSAGEKDQ